MLKIKFVMFEPNQTAMQVLKVGDEWRIDAEFKNIKFCNEPNILGDCLILPNNFVAKNKPVVLLDPNPDLEKIKTWLEEAAKIVYPKKPDIRTLEITVADKLNGVEIDRHNYEIVMHADRQQRSFLVGKYTKIATQATIHTPEMEPKSPYEIIHQKSIVGVHIITVKAKDD